MPIAEVEMPDGRIAQFEVPEGTTQEQVMEFARRTNVAHKPGMRGTEEILPSLGRGLLTTAQMPGTAVINMLTEPFRFAGKLMDTPEVGRLSLIHTKETVIEGKLFSDFEWTPQPIPKSAVSLASTLSLLKRNLVSEAS